MSMVSFVPPSSGEDSAIVALLKVLAHPKDAEATLKKMIAFQKEIDVNSEEYKKLADAHAKNMQDCKEILNQVDISRTSLERERVNLLSAQKAFEEASHNLVLREDAYKARVERLNLEIHAFAQEKANNDPREKAITNKEAAIEHKEEELARREQELIESIDKHKAWLESIKPPRD